MVDPKTPKRRPVAVSTGKSAIKTAKNAKKKFPKVKKGSVTCVPGDGGFGKWSDYENLYHGSSVKIMKPDVERSNHGVGTDGRKKYKDYGKGFYTTSSKKQADRYVKISLSRCNNENGTCLRTGHISEYLFKVNDAKRDLKILVFNGVSKEWLDFIADNHDLNFDHGYDVVIGPVADDKAHGIIDGYLQRRQANLHPDWRVTLKRLKPHLLKDQILFHTKESTDYLIYIKDVIVSVE